MENRLVFIFGNLIFGLRNAFPKTHGVLPFNFSPIVSDPML
jgi:hypothetical protein